MYIFFSLTHLKFVDIIPYFLMTLSDFFATLTFFLHHSAEI